MCRIHNLTVLESGGDGICELDNHHQLLTTVLVNDVVCCADVSGPNGLPGSRDIHITDCVFDKNYRQGMSVIGVVTVLLL